MSLDRTREVHDEPPPFGRTWGRVYACVAVYLGVLIALFAWFTGTFSG